MREDEVAAPAVHVERLPEVACGHGGALDVPAGSPVAPRAGPRGLARLGALPEREVVAVLLAGIDLLAGLHVLEPAMRELAVLGKTANAEVDAAARDGVGEAALHQAADQREHVVDVERGAGLVGGREAAERRGVTAEAGDLALGERRGRDAFFLRAADDLVVDVGEVPDERHAKAARAQPAIEHVGGDQRTRMADVRGRVDGDAAPVEPHVAGLPWHERLLPPGKRVREAQPHAVTPPPRAAWRLRSSPRASSYRRPGPCRPRCRAAGVA